MAGGGDEAGRQRVVGGGIAWLVEQVTGDLADAITRDLITDHIELDSLGWQGLWAYITAAPPGTAIYHARFKGVVLSDHITAEQLYETRKLNWRYGAVHFEGGSDVPYPERIYLPGVEPPEEYAGPTWETATIEDLASPEVLALLRGD